MKTLTILLVSGGLLQPALAQTDRVGVGTTTPRAGLDVSHPDGLVATGTFDLGNTSDLPEGAGTRLMWVPRKGAFRVGGTDGSHWSLSKVGNYSLAAGFNTQARGAQTVVLGSQIGVSGTGSFALGDASGSFQSFSDENRFFARFAQGYVFFTSSDYSTSAFLTPGSNSFSSVSDSTKKSGFRAADGASFLRKIAQMRLGSWNYKGQDARTMRHYGPMAQDFFAAFGHDGIGTVGCDTLINQADFDGVNLIAIQALVRENQELKSEVSELRRLLITLAADVRDLKNLTPGTASATPSTR
jgi:hypothetical protein